MPLVLDGTNGVSGVDGTASNPAIEGTDSNTGIFYPAADTVAIGTGGTEALRVNSSQQVGIGTTSPGYPLHVSSSGNNTKARFTNGTTTLDLYCGGTEVYTGTANSATAWAYANNNTYIAGFVNSSEKIRITSDGYSRFADNGTYTYTGTAHTINNSASNDIVRFFNSNATPYGIFVKYTAADPNNTTSYVFAAEQNTGVNIYKIWSNGTVTARSDAKWKKNIETARDGYAEDLAKLRVVKYNWYNHDDGTPKELGLIAQEVEQVFPGLVMTETDDEGNESKSIKVSVIQTMMLKAIQELNTKVEAQAAEIAALKGNA